MTPDVLSLEASYAACRELTRRAHSSFEASFWLLSRAKHRAMWALYAFMRHTDDLCDNALPNEQRAAALRQWRADVRAALSQAMPGDCAAPGRRLLPALADTVRRFGIPPEYCEAVIDGQEMDLAGTRYATFAHLCQYCERVASAVGLACIHVWGFRSTAAIEPARQCGIALQLTNILRDLKEDTAASRMYLPADDFQQCAYTSEQLAHGDAGPGFLHLMDLEIGRAEAAYRAGYEVLAHLGRDGRLTCGAMLHTYHALLRRIAVRPQEVLLRRVRLSRWDKGRALLRGLLGRPLPAPSDRRANHRAHPSPI
jgi:15-cis-phytoene synthase